jgi:rhodanese-related sulfurtransferase
MNKSINTNIDEVLHKGTTPLDPSTFKRLSDQKDVLVIDTRSKEAYSNEGTIPGAWYIGIDGSFAPWVGALVSDINQKIIFITDDELRIHEIVTRFSRVGYDNTLGYLNGGVASWKSYGYELEFIESISASRFVDMLAEEKVEKPIDVRKESEYFSEHVIGVENFPLDDIHTNFKKINPEKDYFLHCKSGYRSLIAASIFKANGVKKVTNIEGGFKEIVKTKIPLSDYICPTNF